MSEKICLVCAGAFVPQNPRILTCSKWCSDSRDKQMRSAYHKSRYLNDEPYRERIKQRARSVPYTEKKKERDKLYRAKNRERENERKREYWRNRTPEQKRKYYLRNRERIAEETKRRRAKYRMAYMALNQLLSGDTANAT